MSPLDFGIVLAYLALVLLAGFRCRRRASESLESYFLGGRRIHWSMLAMSGAVSNFDITGTMWMVSVLCILGMQSWWHHWMWGVALPAFALAYMARWVRRSRVMTAAEWMSTRFGTGPGGNLARYAAALMSILFTAAVIGYAFQGIGKFASEYVPLEPLAPYLPVSAEWLAAHQAAVLATFFFAVTTLYVVVGGLYSVVLTDVIQTVILSGAALLICWIAWRELTPAEIEAAVPAGFTSLTPSWRLEHLAGTPHAQYEMFGLLTIAWVCKGFLMNAGGPGQLYDFQRFVAARSARDAAKLAAAWPFFLVLRWGMVMGIALLALTGLSGDGDPERVMPIVLREYLPVGVRGLVIAGLVAAFMSTFSSTVNSGASFLVRDLLQPLLMPRAREEILVRCSYLATALIVAAGIAIGARAESIGQIWSWIMMALTAGLIVPNLLRWYWWRLNGWGYAAGVFGGILVTLVLEVRLPPEVLARMPVGLGLLFAGGSLPSYTEFLVVCVGSLIPAVVVSLATPPVDSRTLAEFYTRVRPFGAWGRVRLESHLERRPAEEPRRAILNTALGIAGLTGMYLAPMYLVGHWYLEASLYGALFAACALVLYFTWYRHLPEDEPDGAPSR